MEKDMDKVWRKRQVNIENTEINMQIKKYFVHNKEKRVAKQSTIQVKSALNL